MNEQGRVRSGLLVAISLAGLVMVGVVWLGEGWVARDTLPIRYVRLEHPTVRVNPNNLKAVLAPWAGNSFFSVDLEAVRQAVEALPWVARVRVRKAWPDTLWLHIEEHQPVARWSDHQLVDQHGQLFAIPPGFVPRDLPLLQAGGGDRQTVVDMFDWLQRRLRSHGLALSRLERDELGGWQVELGNGVEVVLGRREVRQRMETFLRVWEQQDLRWQASLARADMRYTHGMAIRTVDSAVAAAASEDDERG